MGHQNRRLNDLGVCQEGEGSGKPFYGIFPDDPHPKEVEAVNRQLSHNLRKTCTKRFLKRPWLMLISGSAEVTRRGPSWGREQTSRSRCCIRRTS